MVERTERVIHPGWLTVMVTDQEHDVWMCHHRCVVCKQIITGEGVFGEDMLTHTRKHRGTSFALELYRFRSALHMLNFYFGLDALVWRDTEDPVPTRFSSDSGVRHE